MMNISLYKKKYNELSKQFRLNYSNQEIAFDLFDLLYDLQKEKQTDDHKLLQSHIYALLEYWQSAYELLLDVDDDNEFKVSSKLFVFSEKAKTHKDDFGIKDIRKLRERKKVELLCPEDIELISGSEYHYCIKDKKIVLFNKYCLLSRLIIIAYTPLDDKAKEAVIEYLYWLSDVRHSLISFYNSEHNDMLFFLDKRADDDWYDTLDVYSAKIYYQHDGDIEASVAIGDQLLIDHIIDLSLQNKEFIEMQIDG